MANRKRNGLAALLAYTGNYRWLLFTGLVLSAVAMIMGMVPYVCIWLVAKDLIDVAPDWVQAVQIKQYGWMAFFFAIGGILLYFVSLMCTHLAAFRTASNIRKKGMAHLMKSPLGFFDNHASGLLRNRLDGAAGETETLLAHNLADIVGTAAMLLAMIVLLFVFDWKMGAACLLAAIISVIALFSMMGGRKASLIAEYQAAQDTMSKAATEYVRGIPVVKVFQQTVHSFKAFRQAIESYSEKAQYYQGNVCRRPQTINLVFTEGAFVFLIPVTLLLAPGALSKGDFARLVTDFAFYAAFSAIISTALAKVMFAASGAMLASNALERIDTVMAAPELPVRADPLEPQGNQIEFKDVCFSYAGTRHPALDHVSFIVRPGQTVALVGPSGGGKTTAACLIPRFWDVTSGSVKVGGTDVSMMDPHTLMRQVGFVFQNNRLFKASILENVRIVRPEASDEAVLSALQAAQCQDILDKLPEGVHTRIGSDGTHLSGGEQQRIALARAILKDAPIIILDEATAFADPENEVLIQRGLARLTKGKTVIMIAHRLSTVVNADKIIVLASGRVAEEGTHAELLKSDGLYARMWASYNQSLQWRISTE